MEATQESTAHADDFDALWKQFEECQPVLTLDELEETSQMLFDADAVRTVRAGLAMLTKSGRELLGVMHSDPSLAGVFEELSDCIEDRVKRLRGVADALDGAQLRLRLALCDARPAGDSVAPQLV